ncbi:hypothetical protein VTJ49DRAFT_3200 [Mycothermus thermophilus]|uniref:R3H-associated N-terminal domain-containing protein n=1 Tax=Humicola insolens TaxID=85995 RepID=A0ABR3VMQ4_HUMIN
MAITHLPVIPPSASEAAAVSGSGADPLPSNPTPAPVVAAPAPTPWHAGHQHSLSSASTATVDIEAWTVAALESLNITPVARGTGTALSIALDAEVAESSSSHVSAAPGGGLKLRGVKFGEGDGDDDGEAPGGRLRRTPSRRDSLRRRESLLMGKEGSRQRRRWENDHLAHVPNVVPPLPSDFQIHPTHPVLPPVPYQLAQYWDLGGLRERAEKRREEEKQRRLRGGSGKSKRKGHATTATATAAEASEEYKDDGRDGMQHQQQHVGRVPRDLRATVKRTPAAREWLRVLEQPVREFVVRCGLVASAENNGNMASSDSETDPDDEEIVFVGRNGAMRDGKPPRAGAAGGSGTSKARPGDVERKGAVLESGMVLEVEEGGGGAFQRWLTHSISDYYGLDSKSVTVGNPARRVVYVAVKQQKPPGKSSNSKHKQSSARHGGKPACRPVLPPPLWEMF